MNRIYTFAFMAALAKSLHSIVIGFVAFAVIFTAYMSYQNVQLNKEIATIGKENQRLLEKIDKTTEETKASLSRLQQTIIESTKSATPKPTPKE
jgi:hypothetical protein